MKISKCFFVGLVAISSCTSPESPLKKQDDKYTRVIKVDSIEYSVEYRAIKKMIAQEHLEISDSEGQKRYHELAGTVWFNIHMKTIGRNASPLRYNLASPEEYEMRLQYFLTSAASDIILLYNGMQIRPMSYTFETNYNLTPTDAMVVGFEIPDNTPVKTMTLSYTDNIFHNGIIKATYQENSLNN